MNDTAQNRKDIEQQLRSAGWMIQNPENPDLHQSLGVAVRNFPLARDYGAIDYLLHLEGKAAGLIEVVPENTPLSGVPVLAEKYSRGLPFTLRLFIRPLPFLYQGNGTDVCFTNAFDPEPKPRPLHGFHRPETLKTWLEDGMVGETPRDMAAEYFPEHRRRGRTFHERLLINLPPLDTDGLSAEQIRMITNLEKSFKENRPRALVDLPAGEARTVAAIRFVDRLMRFADARRVLFLVNSADIAQRLQHTIQNHMTLNSRSAVEALTEKAPSPGVRCCITTLPHLHSLLAPAATPGTGLEEAVPPAIPYHPGLPIETFDIVLLDTCDASLNPFFRPALTYFDAYLIGLTEKPDPAAIDFFDGNLVMEDSGKQHPDGLDVI